MKFTNAPWGINKKKLISKGMWEMARRDPTGAEMPPPIAVPELSDAPDFEPEDLLEVLIEKPVAKKKVTTIKKKPAKKK